MVENRASRGARLLSITIVREGYQIQREEVLKLMEHVTHVEYRVEQQTPTLGDMFGESAGGGE